MDHDHLSTGIAAAPAGDKPTATSSTLPAAASTDLARRFSSAVTGVTPPQLGEATVREAWPTLAATPGLSTLGAKLILTIFLAPLGWLVLAPLLGKKFSPFICRRYTLTNRRLMIRRGLKPAMAEEVLLADIDDVRIDPNSVSSFPLRDLEIIAQGQTKMKLAGVPEADSYRLAILNAVAAWVPGKAAALNVFQSAASASKA